MLVQQGVVKGRIGKVKTEASNDEIPLDPAFADVLLKLKGGPLGGARLPVSRHRGLLLRWHHSAADSETQGRRNRHHGARVAFFKAHVPFAPGRDGCSHWSPAQADAS